MTHSIAKILTLVSVLCLVSTPVTLAEDSYPFGTLAFFNREECPSGWIPAEAEIQGGSQPVNGFMVVPFYSPATGSVGKAVGLALSNLEDRMHTHTFGATVSLSEVKYQGASGCCNDNLTSNGDKSFTGDTDAASANVPYVQALLCEKTQFSPPTNPPVDLPTSIVTFFSTEACPTGWKKTQTTTGRVLVGLPEGGIPGTSFGGDPLSTPLLPIHDHDFSGTVHISSHGIALASGCFFGCAGGYGNHGNRDYEGTTGEKLAALPYLPVTQCQPCVEHDSEPSCHTGVNG